MSDKLKASELLLQSAGPFDAACVEVIRMEKEIQSLQAEVERLREENANLRLMLAVSYSGPLLYSDDGELQDNRVQSFIDFIRDSVQKIADKMKQRSINELTERG